MSRRNCAIGKDVVPASFKGVQFYCTDANVEGGRRGAEGEFPFGEHTAYADLGRKIRVYHLTAKFREDDHVSDSMALFAACESPGPGILVHPTRGVVMVACRSCKVKDSLEEKAGETEAELEFVEANTIGPSFGLGASLFGIVSTALNAVSRDSFIADYRPAALPQPWRGDVIDRAQALVAADAAAYGRTLSSSSPTSEHRSLSRMNEVATDDGLAVDAINVDAAMQTGFSGVATNVADSSLKFTTFRNLANVAVHSSVITIGSELEGSVLSRQRILAAIGMAEAAMGQQFPYVGDALNAMQVTLAAFEDEARAAYDQCNNGLFLEIKRYATEFTKVMYDLAYRLPGLVAINFAGGVHPLVASYAIYNDAKRHRELEPRNIVDANGRIGPVVVGIA